MSPSDMLAREQLVPLRKLIARIPGGRGADRIHPSTAVRWCVRGVKLRSGEVLKLEHVRAGGGQHLSSEQALRRFLDAVTNGTTDAPVSPPAPTPTAAKRAAERAVGALDKVLTAKA